MTGDSSAELQVASKSRGRTTTVRVRLLVALALLFALGLAGFGLVTTSLYSRTLNDQLDAQLHAAVPLMTTHLVAQAGLPNRQVHAPGNQTLPTGQRPGDSSAANGGGDPSLIIPPGTWGELLSLSGKVLAVAVASSSTGQPAVPAALPTDGAIITVPAATGSSSWRLIANPSPGNTTTIVAVSTADVRASLTRLIAIELLVGLGLLMVLSTASFLIITRSLRPLESMASTATAIAAGDLSRRVEVATSARELDELRRALNTMLDEIQASFAEREAVERKLRQFLADASHELRTPLTSISGFAEILRLGGTAAVDPAVAAIRIESEASRMSRLVDDLLMLARLDEVTNEPLVEVDLVILAADACSDAIVTDRTRTITLNAPAPVIVVGVEDHLRQAMANLLTNVLRYTPSGSPIDVSVHNVGSSALVAVNDRGPGIPEALIPQIFDRFFQIDPSRTGAGSGLGLAIVAAVCDECGGLARASNREGGGLSVELLIPLAAAPAPAPAQ